MYTINTLKYKVLSILEALKLYEFPVKGTVRITKTLASLKNTIEQLHIGATEANDEANEVQEELDALVQRHSDLIAESRKANIVRNNLMTLTGE